MPSRIDGTTVPLRGRRYSLTDLLPLHAKRVTLRRLALTDLADFQNYRTDPQVALYQGWQPQSDKRAAEFLNAASTARLFEPGVWFQIGIAIKDSDTLIGDIGICLAPDGPEAEIGFSLHSQSQGRGLASEAVGAAITFIFDNTNCKKIVGIVDARNHSAILLLERLGMRRDKTVDAVFEGKPCKEHVFELQRAAG